MIEILGGIPGHAEALHDRPGGPVRRHGVGNDLRETEAAEAVVDCGARRLERVTLSPIGRHQAPRRLDGRREGELPAHPIQPDNPDERRLAGQLDDEIAETMLVPMAPHAPDPGLGRGLIERRQIEHAFGVGRHRDKRREVVVAPFAQQQARRAQGERHGYFFPPPERPAIWLKNISWSCSKPLKPAGSQVFSIVSGSSAFRLARTWSSTSCNSFSCIGFTSGRPKKPRNSSGVQSISSLIFMPPPFTGPGRGLDKPGPEWQHIA
jgi:hypothetical protein